MKQAQTFLIGEGDAWLKRNKEKLPPKQDPVARILELNNIVPKRVLEVGCADGWRLKALSDTYRCEVAGIDPGKSTAAWIEQGTASSLPYKDNAFDLVIYGFCLYLCDREDLFRIVTEGDRVLANGGYLIIHDFFVMMDPYKRKYAHKDGLFSYKMNYFKLWTANPAYEVVDVGRPDDDTVVYLLKKDINKGWPLHE